MRIRARSAMLLASLFAGSAAIALSARAEDSPTSKTFADHNFQLTVPSEEWKFEDVPAANKPDGFVTVVRRKVSKGVEVAAWIRVVDAHGAEIDSMMTQVKEAKVKALANVTEDKIDTIVWAGVTASLATVKGKYSNGSFGFFRVYGAIVEGQFHEMDLRFMNGAEESIGSEIESLVEGYHLLKGGLAPSGNGDTPAAMDDPAGGGDAPTQPSGDAEGPLTKVFPNAGLSWSLPKPEGADKPKWVWGKEGKLELSRTDKGLLAIAGLVLPDGSNPIDVQVTIEPTPVGATAQAYADTPSNAEQHYKHFSGSPIPKSDDDVPIGNYHGAAVSIRGNDLGDPPKPLQIRMYFAVQKRALYLVLATLRDSAEKTYKGEFRALLDGLKWADPSEGLRGPVVIPGLQPDTEPRGKFADKEIDPKIPKGHGFVLTSKPAGFALLPIDGTNKDAQYGGHQVFWYAAEARNAKSYAFVGICAYPTSDFMNQKPPKDPLTVIDDLESAWRNLFTDAVTRPKSDKTNRASGSLNGAQGAAYVFKGSSHNLPYVEYGWMVKSGQFWYLVRTQYAGKDGEADFGPAVKTMLKSLKYE